MWAQLYKPDLAILHMGGDHDPIDFAEQVKMLKTENPNLKTIVPHHNRVTPPAGQTDRRRRSVGHGRDGPGSAS